MRYRVKLARMIQAKREFDLNETQIQFAARFKVSPFTIGKWEGGKGKPDVPSYRLLCELLEITMDQLVDLLLEYYQESNA